MKPTFCGRGQASRPPHHGGDPVIYNLPRSKKKLHIYGAEWDSTAAGIPLEEMTDDQLKIEYRNANSVAYKTKKAGRDATKAEERLEHCKAEMEKRGIQPTARAAAKVDAATVANMIKSGALSVDDIQALLDAQ